jgi:hypothetical protein
MMQRRHRVLVFLCFVSVFSCQKLPDLSNNDGIPANPEAVTSAMVEAWGDQTQEELQDSVEGAKIRKCETVAFSKSAQFFTQPSKEFEIQLFQVTKIALAQQNVEGQIINLRNVDVIVRKQDVSDNSVQKPIITTQHTYGFQVSPRTATDFSAMANDLNPLMRSSEFHANSGPEPLSVDYFVGYAFICNHNPKENWKPYCYNLRTWQSVEAAPLINPDPACLGIPNCKINVNNVAFDLVSEVHDEQEGKTTRQKTLIHLKFTRDVPFLSRLVSACFQGMGKYRNQPYVATVCTDVINFTQGIESDSTCPFDEESANLLSK